MYGGNRRSCASRRRAAGIRMAPADKNPNTGALLLLGGLLLASAQTQFANNPVKVRSNGHTIRHTLGPRWRPGMPRSLARHAAHRPRARRVQVGSKIPAIELDHGFAGSDGVKVNLAERVKGKKVILVGLPGAFTPT